MRPSRGCAPCSRVRLPKRKEAPMPARLARLRPRSIYDVMAVLGCVAALGTGSAYAANTIGSADIIDESILSQDIQDGQISSADVRDRTLANGGLVATDLRTGSVGAAEIAANGFGAQEVLDESLTASDLGSDSVSA